MLRKLWFVGANPSAEGVEREPGACEKPLDQPAGGHFGGGQVVQGGGVDEQDRIAQRKGDVEVVGRKENAPALVVGEPPEQRRQRVAVGQVEKRRGLVEEDDGGVLGQRPGDHGPLALAVGKGLHRLAGEVGDADRFERVPDGGPVALLHAPEPIGVGGAAEGDHILAGEVGDADLVGGDERNGGRQLSGIERGNRRAAKPDLSALSGPQPGDDPQQRTFSGAVAADESGERCARNLGRNLFEQHARPVGQPDMMQGNTHPKKLRLRTTTRMTTGMPISAVMLLMGRASVLASKSQPSSNDAPASIEAGISVRWSARRNSMRAMWGTASPTKPTGPQNAVTVPASRMVERKIKARARGIWSPMVRA